MKKGQNFMELFDFFVRDHSQLQNAAAAWYLQDSVFTALEISEIWLKFPPFHGW